MNSEIILAKLVRLPAEPRPLLNVTSASCLLKLCWRLVHILAVYCHVPNSGLNDIMPCFRRALSQNANSPSRHPVPIEEGDLLRFFRPSALERGLVEALVGPPIQRPKSRRKRKSRCEGEFPVREYESEKN